MPTRASVRRVGLGLTARYRIPYAPDGNDHRLEPRSRARRRHATRNPLCPAGRARQAQAPEAQRMGEAYVIRDQDGAVPGQDPACCAADEVPRVTRGPRGATRQLRDGPIRPDVWSTICTRRQAVCLVDGRPLLPGPLPGTAHLGCLPV